MRGGTESGADSDVGASYVPARASGRPVHGGDDVEGHEHEEVAKILGCSVGTSKSQLHKARMKLRRLLRRKEQPKAAIDSSYELLRHIEASIRASAAGITVTHDEALKCPAVAVSVKVISESVAQLPFNIFRVGEDGDAFEV